MIYCCASLAKQILEGDGLGSQEHRLEDIKRPQS
jgi:hypothetical protein